MRIRDWSSDVFSSDLVSVAVSIADTDDAGVQDILQKAYESRQLRGRRLLMAKRLIESRRRRGKGLRGSYHRTGLVTSDALLRAYRDDAEKKCLLVRKAEATRDRLVFMTEDRKSTRLNSSH